MTSMYLRSKCLGQKDDDPIGVFRNIKVKKNTSQSQKLRTSSNELLSLLMISPTKPRLENTRPTLFEFGPLSFSTERGVLVHTPYIKIRLFWKSNTFLNYLCNARAITSTHSDILSKINDFDWDVPNMPEHYECIMDVEIDHIMRPILIENYEFFILCYSNK